MEPLDPRSIFVVHGRDLRLRDAMFAFLRALDLKPLEFVTASLATGKTTPYVGEILDAAFSLAQAIVVVFSPDDEARLRPQFVMAEDPPHEVQFTPQARPNVIFEAGMALGRNPHRTILVEVGVVRPFSDIGGRHVIRLNNTSARRQEFAHRLMATGCTVDLSGTAWHTTGDFSPYEQAIRQKQPPPWRPKRLRSYEPDSQELDVLKFLAETGTETLTTQVATQLKLSQHRAAYYLERLHANGLIGRTTVVGGPERWELGKNGRDVLIHENLL